MSDIIQHLDEITKATTVERVWALHTAKMATYGFDRLLYGYTQFMGATSLGDPEDWFILSTQTPEYLDTFVGEGLYFSAPMLRWAVENTGACSWRMMHDRAAEETLSPSERKVLEFNISMDVVAGYTISFSSASSRSRGAIALTAACGMSQDDVDEVWARDGREIQLLNDVMHLKVQSLPHSGERNLTRRQREVLQWVGDGKSIQDIAYLLGLTPATVEKHLRLAREALGVDTTPQAVLKAAMHNQLFIAEP